MTEVSFKIEGIDDLLAAFDELSVATQRNTLYRVLFKAAAPMDAAWRQRAPSATGKLRLSGGIAKTGGVVGGDAYSAALSAGASKPEAVIAKRDALRETSDERGFADVTIGPGRNPQALFNEFGTAHQPARPYFRPAWDATKDEALRIIGQELSVEIEKSAARMRARASRHAA